MPLWKDREPEIKLSIGNDGAKMLHRQMLIALTLLLVALIIILTKDRDFWFPPAPAMQSESEPAEEVSPKRMAQSAATPTPQPIVPGQGKMKLSVPTGEPKPGKAPTAIIPSRTVLPPLEVEVVAGNQHQPIRESNNSVKVDLQSHTVAGSEQPFSVQEAANSASASDPSGRVHLSPETAEVVLRSVEPNYPLLAKQMKIQGAVVLEALIGREGNIQHIQVLSGPAILSAAAQQAVQQWRFRPYVLSGKAVETESRITVSFTISTL